MVVQIHPGARKAQPSQAASWAGEVQAAVMPAAVVVAQRQSACLTAGVRGSNPRHDTTILVGCHSRSHRTDLASSPIGPVASARLRAD